jgi:hypothetical protein
VQRTRLCARPCGTGPSKTAGKFFSRRGKIRILNPALIAKRPGEQRRFAFQGVSGRRGVKLVEKIGEAAIEGIAARSVPLPQSKFLVSYFSFFEQTFDQILRLHQDVLRRIVLSHQIEHGAR